jgi:hypothetical protein
MLVLVLVLVVVASVVSVQGGREKKGRKRR